ncbi:hypothetical protein CALVIDRAFT_19064 [Calocera viscosa TUFC12733]|uniref:Zn(2)-C6 fungal-type domain-containing protein n=1 Tax=Calocera viscosa (strain TUFC12733) TaxID=1330018 RepID=A0A167SEJ3_CALVF|nr:hypothetical protein CALVIDRAFT_19064 [Calocera viscosa TUFC12733]
MHRASGLLLPFAATAPEVPQFNPSQINPSQFNPSQFNPSQFNPSQFNPTQFNPPQFNPTQFNPPQFNAYPAAAGPSTSPLSDDTDASYDNTPSTSVADGFSPGMPELPEPTKKKRRRRALNCKECKRRKIQCDRETPCGKCVARGEGDRCEFDSLPAADKPIGRSSYNALKEQLIETQNAFKQLQKLYREQASMPVPPSPSPSTQQNPIVQNPLDPVEQFREQAQSSRQSSRKQLAANAAFNHLPVASSSTPARGRAALIQGLETLDGFPIFPGLITGVGKDENPDATVESDVWTCVPEKWICDTLTQFFFDKVEWHICMFHRPSFYRVYEEFWSVPTVADRVARIAPEWMALWWAIMCLALTSMNPKEPSEPKIWADRDDWKTMGTRFWKIAHTALDESDYMSSNSIEVVQTLVLFSYCNLALSNKGYNGQAPMTALAIRISMNQGLHSMGGETEQVIPPEGLVTREVKRRVWWNVVFLDWNISTQMHRTYLIHPAQCHTAKPLNLDWEDMVEGRPLYSKPNDQHTNVSMLLAKILLAGTVRELCDRLNSKLGIDPAFLDQHQAQQNQVERTLPPCLREFPASDGKAELSVVQWEGLQFQLHLNNRRIRLHRPFMRQGYVDSKYLRSTQVCISSAQKILVLFREGRRKRFPGSSAWYNLMYCWMAAVILTVDEFESRIKELTEVGLTSTSRRDHIKEAIAALEEVGDISDLAPRGAKVLQFLLHESTSIQLDDREIENIFNMQFGELSGQYGLDLSLSNPKQIPTAENPMIDLQWSQQMMVGQQNQYSY